MDLVLDHFFILTDCPGKAGDLLLAAGLTESFSRDHKGQGTSNRRFVFSDGMLELLYIRDREEAESGPAKGLRFIERLASGKASPFGLIFTIAGGASKTDGFPFGTWEYQPEYFAPPNAFSVANNSEVLEEPLCIIAPYDTPNKCDQKEYDSVDQVELTIPSDCLSKVLEELNSVDRLKLSLGSEHLLELSLDSPGETSLDMRPDLPLIIHYRK